jgi:hypothetical protein
VASTDHRHDTSRGIAWLAGRRTPPVAAFLAFGLTLSGPARASRPGDPEEQDFGYRSHAREIADEVRINGLAVPVPEATADSSTSATTAV